MSEKQGESEKRALWLFGYGSLIWKPPPHYDLRVPGFIKSYVRRFWQASEDHRGTPSSPGRVATLIARSYWSQLNEPLSYDEPDAVYGTAYRIPAEHVEEVKAYLDIREVNGYSIQYTTFYPSNTSEKVVEDEKQSGDFLPRHSLPDAVVEDCLVYIGLPSNPQFLGMQTLEDVASVIVKSEGPSGRNVEYLFMLERALQGLGVGDVGCDRHVSELVDVVKGMMGGEEGEAEGEKNEMERVRSGEGGDAKEETEKIIIAAVHGE